MFWQQYTCLTTDASLQSSDGNDNDQSWLPRGFEFLAGLPSWRRKGRLILTLQGWFDDSGTKGTGRFMSMAGLFGESDSLKQVSTEWERYLRAVYPGKLQRFKLDDACTLDGEFKFWTEQNRDLKVQQMARIIDRDDLYEIAVVLDLDAYACAFPAWAAIRDAETGTRHALRQPYVMLFHYVLTEVVSEAVRRGSTRPVELFLDQHDVFKRPILDHYDGLLQEEEAFPERRAVMPSQPWFRDDTEWVLLQAADLLAGEARLVCECDASGRLLPDCVRGICPTLKHKGHFKPLLEDELRELEAHVRRVTGAFHQVEFEDGLNHRVSCDD